jgi:general secretion pathway protein G
MIRVVRKRPDRRALANESREAGFTLVEMLVVLGILALVATLVAPQVLKYLSRAKSETARVQISHISSALELYYIDMGRYPTQQEGLAALVRPPAGAKRWSGPYLKKADGLTDPWGQPYAYVFPGRYGAFDLFSLGRDNASGGEGEDRDVVSW